MADDEDWIYNLDGKPWGIAEVNAKSLSLRDDAGGGRTRRWIKATVVPGGPTGETVVQVALHHQKRASEAKPYAPLNLTSLHVIGFESLSTRRRTRALYRHLQHLLMLMNGGARPLHVHPDGAGMSQQPGSMW